MSVKVSPKFQVVIPEPVRTALGIVAGTRMEVMAMGKVAYLVPVPDVRDLQNSLAGKLDQDNVREKIERKL